MNGPIKNSMYHLRPVFKLQSEIELPKNMYILPKIQAVGEPGQLLNSIQDKSAAGETTGLERRWDEVLKQLQDLKAQLAEIKKTVENTTTSQFVAAAESSHLSSSRALSLASSEIQVLDGAVINANPNSPPYSLLLIQQLYKGTVNVNISCHAHSTAGSAAQEATAKFQQTRTIANGVPTINLFLIWKQGILETQLVVNPWKQIGILGEVNILRYLCRLGLSGLQYNDNDISNLAIETILDTCHRLLHVKTVKEKVSIARNLNGKLGKSSFFCGNEVSLCDIAAWSAFKQSDLASSSDLSDNISKWFLRVDAVLK